MKKKKLENNKYEFFVGESKFILPDEWASFLGEQVLSKEISVAFRLKQLGVPPSKVTRFINNFLINSPSFNDFYSREEQASISKLLARKTLSTKYGVSSPFALDSVKKKIRQTNLDKYGVSNPIVLDEFKQKRATTNLKKYGGNAPACSKEIRDKMSKTNMERYGGISSFSSSEVIAKKNATNM